MIQSLKEIKHKLLTFVDPVKPKVQLPSFTRGQRDSAAIDKIQGELYASIAGVSSQLEQTQLSPQLDLGSSDSDLPEYRATEQRVSTMKKPRSTRSSSSVKLVPKQKTFSKSHSIPDFTTIPSNKGKTSKKRQNIETRTSANSQDVQYQLPRRIYRSD